MKKKAWFLYIETRAIYEEIYVTPEQYERGVIVSDVEKFFEKYSDQNLMDCQNELFAENETLDNYNRVRLIANILEFYDDQWEESELA